MDKIAQERGIFNKLREKVNMPGSYLEGFFKPELDRVMTSLKELDDRIRSILTGKQIGTGQAPADGMAAKDILKNARTNFNRREYMTAVADLGRFHKKMYDVSQDIGKFFVDVNKIHHKFLFEGADDEKIQNLRKHMDETLKKASSNPDYFIKEAGIMDFFYNIGTKRGRGLAAWEKKYPKQTKDLRDGGDRLINEAQKLLENSIGYLKQMATARATRRPDEYMDIANRLKADFEKFDNSPKGFREYYNTAIIPWLKIKDEIEAREKPVATTQAPTPPVPQSGQVELGEQTPVTGVPAMPGGTSAAPAIPPDPITLRDVSTPDTTDEEHLPFDLVPKNSAHDNFYRSLETLSQESPVILAKYIAKYASSIQRLDPETAIKLFGIVKKIKG
jgi:hypothetical protein